jgi:hypothetical protein
MFPGDARALIVTMVKICIFSGSLFIGSLPSLTLLPAVTVVVSSYQMDCGSGSLCGSSLKCLTLPPAVPTAVGP